MKAVTEEVLRRLTAAIVEVAQPEQIYLFGSQARGSARNDSDVDLLIVDRQPFGPERSRQKELARLWKLAAAFRVAADLLLFSRAEVEAWRNSRNHIVAHALREGRLLYERP